MPASLTAGSSYSSKSLRLPLQTGLRTYRRAFRDIHTPLLITPFLIFLPPREHQTCLCRTHRRKSVFNRSNKAPSSSRGPTPPPCSKQTFRVLRHYNNAAGSMAEVRDEKTQWRRLVRANKTHRKTFKTIATFI